MKLKLIDKIRVFILVFFASPFLYGVEDEKQSISWNYTPNEAEYTQFYKQTETEKKLNSDEFQKYLKEEGKDYFLSYESYQKRWELACTDWTNYWNIIGDNMEALDSSFMTVILNPLFVSIQKSGYKHSINPYTCIFEKFHDLMKSIEYVKTWGVSKDTQYHRFGCSFYNVPYQTQLLDYYNTFPKNQTEIHLADIGCGNGLGLFSMIKGLIQEFKTGKIIHYDGFDINPDNQSVFQKTGDLIQKAYPRARIECSFFRQDIKNWSPTQNYNLIFLNRIMHFCDPTLWCKFMPKITNSMTQNGHIFVFAWTNEDNDFNGNIIQAVKIKEKYTKDGIINTFHIRDSFEKIGDSLSFNEYSKNSTFDMASFLPYLKSSVLKPSFFDNCDAQNMEYGEFCFTIETFKTYLAQSITDNTMKIKYIPQDQSLLCIIKKT